MVVPPERFKPYHEEDWWSHGSILAYQSISCMPYYQKLSFEELRLQDYGEGRKTALPFVGLTSAQDAGEMYAETESRGLPAFGSSTSLTYMPVTGNKKKRRGKKR